MKYTAPYFPDDAGEVGERIARGEEGKNYYVPADMKYSDWKEKFVTDAAENAGKPAENTAKGGIIGTGVERLKEADVVIAEQSKERKPKRARYTVTQEQIDEILSEELKDYQFPVKPIYNPRIRDNGITTTEVFRTGEIKGIKLIQIGKQDIPGKAFLIDTLLHEYLETEILIKQNTNSLYRRLNESDTKKRHNWINKQISKFFKKLETRQ